jgi:hypothetical protein
MFNVATTAGIFFEFDEERFFEKPDCKRGDLILPFGSFLVSNVGVKIDLASPFGAWSGHKKWSEVAPGIAALWLIISGERPHVSEQTFCDVILGMMTSHQRDVFEWRLDNEDWIEAADTLIKRWTIELADRCPQKTASNSLRRIAKMDVTRLDSYAMKHFLS